MSLHFQQVQRTALVWIWILLGFLPPLIQAEDVSRSGSRDHLSEIQEAVGKNWSVVALSDGYLLIYGPPVSFYSAISESSKMDDYQRVAHGRMDHLRIRITLYPPLTKKTSTNVSQFNAYWDRVRQCVPGYFPCADKDWDMWQDDVVIGRAVNHDIVWFSCNIPPDCLVTASTKEIYEHTLDVLAPYFHAARHAPWIED